MSEAETPQLNFALRVTARIESTTSMGATPFGERRVIPISGGDFEGPRLRGIILPGGEDWQLQRTDGVTELDARYWMRTDDGQIIRVHNRAMVVQQPGTKPYVRCAPTFQAPIGQYDWLNKAIFVGTLTVDRSTSQPAVILNFYQVD